MKFVPFLFYSILFTLCLIRFDRYCFKQNDGFCFRNIHSDLAYRPGWDLPSNSLPFIDDIDKIFDQKFTYLNKGHQSYVFISEDQNYVIKFYRFPSHMRALPWLNRPLSYHLSSKRKKIKSYNLEKLDLTFQSFKLAFEELKDQTGLVYIHLNKTHHLNRMIKIKDKLGIEYDVDLDSIQFIVQKKANLLFPTLELLLAGKDHQTAKRLLSSLIELMIARSQKGIIDQDPVLERNYGIIDTSVIHIDVGRFVKNAEVTDSPEFLKQEFLKNTECLKNWLKNHDQELFDYYQHLIENIL